MVYLQTCREVDGLGQSSVPARPLAGSMEAGDIEAEAGERLESLAIDKTRACGNAYHCNEDGT